MPIVIPDHLRQQQTYSEDLRKRVIYQCYMLERQIETISSDLNISKRVIERILHLWRTMGEVMIPQKKKKRIRVMTPQEMDLSIPLVQEFPNLYLDEMQKILQEMFGVVVGISTLWATL
ncbi:hypothetical protein K439DRAFT_1367501 [Ramaria rubella]|nr:hypothetical protein K439DRAFT_1367501 [Ramaria rubella]